MDPMVSARVPIELRDQVNKELRKAGSSPTELINSAYEFFLKTRQLPSAIEAPRPGKRKFSRAAMSSLMNSIKETTLPTPESYFENTTYDNLLADALRESYENLS